MKVGTTMENTVSPASLPRAFLVMVGINLNTVLEVFRLLY